MSERIYVADSDLQVMNNINAVLERAGFEVKGFESGSALLKGLTDNPASLIVLDVMTPGAEEFIRCRKEQEINAIPVIILVDRETDVNHVEGLDLNIDDYLTRPFSPMALVTRIKTVFMRMEFDRMVYAEQS